MTLLHLQAYTKYSASEEAKKVESMAVVGAFSGMAAIYVLIGMTLGLVISCSVSL